MKVSIVCACHPACFIQHTSPFNLSFGVRSKVVMGMLLPMVLSELVESDDKKPRRGKTQEWTKWRYQLGSFQNIIKQLIAEDQCAFKEMSWMSVEDFEALI